MNFKKLLLSTAIATAVVWLGTSSSEAQTQNPERITYFTFTQPVTIPGSTLPAGRYRFQILQSLTDRGILRIQDGEGTKTFATVLVVPSTRPDPVASPELRFLETSSEAPPALGSYWQFATGAGWEFVYPKDQAEKLAINTKNPVLTGPAAGRAADQTTVVGLTRTSPSGATPYARSTAPAPVSGGVLRGSANPSDNSVAEAAAADSANQSAADRSASNQQDRDRSSASLSQSVSETPSRPAPVVSNNTRTNQSASGNSMSDSDRARSNRTTLPATAGSTPLAGLAGLAAFIAAFGLSTWRRRTA